MKSGYNVLCASRGIDVSGGCINVMEEAADPELESLLFDPCCLIFYSKGLMITMKKFLNCSIIRIDVLESFKRKFTWQPTLHLGLEGRGWRLGQERVWVAPQHI